MTEIAAEWQIPTEEQFASFLKANLMPSLRGCEALRQCVVRHLWTAGGIAAVVAAGGTALVLAMGGEGFLFVIPVLVAAIIFGFAYSALTKGYRQRFKQSVVAPIVRFFGEGFQYYPEGCVSRGEFLRSRIFEHRIDRYRGEDLVSGRAGKTDFVFSEVHAEYKTTTRNSKGRRRTQWHTIFKGLFFIGDFHKHFEGTTLVLPDVAESALGWLGQKLQGLNFARPGSLVKLEDPEFEKLFVVYGTDQVEARYILSPSLMRRLVEFRRECRRSVYLSFADECVFVAVNPEKNLQEPSVFSALDYSVCREVYADLSFALGIIEDLNLNTRIWSKQ